MMRGLRVFLCALVLATASVLTVAHQVQARPSASAQAMSVQAMSVQVMSVQVMPVLASGPARVLAPALPELLQVALQRVAARMVEASRQLSPSLADRLDAMLQERNGGAEQPQVSAARRTGSALARVSGVAVIGLVIALVVLVTALGPLEGVIKTVEADVSGAFWRGLLAQAFALPILAAILLALALTVIGLLVVPIAIMASLVVVAGVSTLGILAVAAVIGRSRASNDRARSRAGLLRALLIGYAVVWLPWLVAALLVSVPGIGLAARIVALAATWVAATVGTGAVLRSRGGVRIPDVVPARTAIGASAPAPDWSTPTPVMGVVAARLTSSRPSAD